MPNMLRQSLLLELPRTPRWPAHRYCLASCRNFQRHGKETTDLSDHVAQSKAILCQTRPAEEAVPLSLFHGVARERFHTIPFGIRFAVSARPWCSVISRLGRE